MSDKTMPARHEDPLLDLFRPYIAATAQALLAEGVELERSWLDPSGPRDATIVCRVEGEHSALVWDEESGWRLGRFVSGRQGERTRLSEERFLGEDVLPEPREVAQKVLTGGFTRPARKFRDHSDAPDAFDAKVRATYSG
jgi:hypothetical protein